MKRGLRVKTGVKAPARVDKSTRSIDVGILQSAIEREYAPSFIASLYSPLDYRPDLPPIEDALAASTNMTTLVPLIRCTSPKACGHCWYCKRAHDEVNGHVGEAYDPFSWERPF